METVAAWFDGANRVLFVHAHPDDETIATGGTLAALAAAGRDPGLVTLTRGERGEVRTAELQHLQGSPQLAAHRELELQGALEALGVQRHAFLGTPPARGADLEPRVYRDSGMEWAEDGLAESAPDAGVEALTAAPAAELIADLMSVALAWNIDAIVSYDALGGYRHPDHVRAHQLARAVAVGLEVPFWEIVTERDTNGASGGADDISRDAVGVAGAETGARETPGAGSGVTGADPAADHGGAAALNSIVSYEILPWCDAKRSALAAHATQLVVDGDDIVHVGGQRQAIDQIERFRRLT